MSELINASIGRNNFRRHLLTTASALALIANVYGIQDAKADSDTDRPTLWIELGGQLEQQTGQGDAYTPSFVANNPDSLAYKPVSPLHLEKPPVFSNGAEAKLKYEPSDTNWVFSAAVRYGRSVGHRDFRQSQQIKKQEHHTSFVYTHTRTYARHLYSVTNIATAILTEFANTQLVQRQSHVVLDFAAGKDVGLGMFGKDSVSDFSVGVRFVQFASKISGTLNARPKGKFTESHPTYITPSLYTRFPKAKFNKYGNAFHSYNASLQSQRSFHGIGPALSWNASMPLFGEQPTGTLNFDWGVNAALLFGRQRASGRHHTYGYYHASSAPSIPRTHHSSSGSFNRSKAVTIPNIGGFAGVSFNFTTVKVSAGYRGDFFFGAMDTGNDTRKTKTVGFYGPFATVSFGIGG